MGLYKQVSTTEELSDFAVRYVNKELIGDLVAPVTETNSKVAKYLVFDRRVMAQITDALVAPDGNPNERKFNATWTEVGYKPYALADKIPITDLGENPAIDLEEETVEHLTNDLLLGREKRIADLVMTAGSYAAANKVTLGTAWTDGVSSTPITDIQTAKRAVAMPANTMIMDELSYDALARHPDVIAYLRGNGGARNGLASSEELLSYFGLRILVGRAKYDQANPGQSADYVNIWPQGKVLIAHVDPAPRTKTATLARTFAYKPDAGNRIHVETWDELRKGTHGVRWVKCSTNEVSALTAADTGYLISGAA